MEQQKEKNTTSISMKNRSLLSVSGASDIISSDESSVYLETLDGSLLIEGTELHIISMSVGNKEMLIEGRFNSLSFTDKAQTQKIGFFARMFK